MSSEQKNKQKEFIKKMMLIFLIFLYVGLRFGYFFTTNNEDFFEAAGAFGEEMFVKPWVVFPTDPMILVLALVIFFGFFIFQYKDFILFRDVVNDAHGDAAFEENYNQYEREFVIDPSIIEKETGMKVNDKTCPRDEDGKRIVKKIIKPYSGKNKKFKNAINKCRKNAMILTNTISLSLNGNWCQRNSNTIVFGASGTGKSRYFLKPNILQANSSIVVTDPSADVLLETGDFLQRKGYKIIVFNTDDMTKSARFNPLAYIKNTSDIPVLVDIYLTNINSAEKKGGDGDFWEKAAKSLLCCTIAYLFEVCPLEQRNFKNVLDLLKLDKHDEDEGGGIFSEFDMMFQKLGEANPTSYAYNQYLLYTQSPIKVRNSVLVSTTVNLSMFDIPEVANATYKDELELDLIDERKTALFLVLPQAKQTYSFLSAMLYGLLFQILYAKQERIQGEKEYVRFLIDECANIGKISNLEMYLATCRRYRIAIVPIFQNYSQIVEVYGKDKANNIVSNCDCFLFLGGKDKDTLNIIIDNLGKETVKVLNQSINTKHNNVNSLSKQATGKELMSKIQVATMSNSECLLFIRALKPFKTKKYDLMRHPNAKYLSEGSEGKPFPIPFKLEYEDEEIESVRIKSISEEGYFKPEIVDSAKRRNLINTNKKKIDELNNAIMQLETKIRNELDNSKKQEYLKQIECLKEEISKLSGVLNTEKTAENYSEPEVHITEQQSAEELIKENPEMNDAVSINPVESYSPTYEFDGSENEFSVIESLFESEYS